MAVLDVLFMPIRRKTAATKVAGSRVAASLLTHWMLLQAQRPDTAKSLLMHTVCVVMGLLASCLRYSSVYFGVSEGLRVFLLHRCCHTLAAIMAATQCGRQRRRGIRASREQALTTPSATSSPPKSMSSSRTQVRPRGSWLLAGAVAMASITDLEHILRCAATAVYLAPSRAAIICSAILRQAPVCPGRESR